MTSISSPPCAEPNAAVPPRAAYKWWVVLMLWFVCFFNYADRQAIFAVFPKLEQEFGFDEVQLGMIGSAFMWVYAAGAPLAGVIGDRLPRKHLILGGCLFWSFVTLTTGWCRRLWQFVSVRALEGFGETFYFPASVSLVSDYHGPATRSRALSLHQSSVYAGTILGGWIGAWLAEHYGWRWGFYLFGTSGMVLAILLYCLLREPRRGQSEPAGELQSHLQRGQVHVFGQRFDPKTASRGRKMDQTPDLAVFQSEPAAAAAVPARMTLGETLAVVFRRPAAVVLMLAFFGANFVAMVFLAWTPTFLVKKFDFGLAAAAFAGTLFINAASALSVPLAGWLADSLVRRMPGGRMLVQALGLLVGAGLVVVVGHTGDARTLMAAMAAFGFCKGFYDSGIFASLYDVVPPAARATAAGIMNTVGWGGGALGPLAIGWAAVHGPYESKVQNMSAAIGLGGGVYIVAAILLLVAALVLMRRSPTTALESLP